MVRFVQPVCRGQDIRLLDYGEIQRGLWHVCLQRHLCNHESLRRCETFVTRKVKRGLANIAQGLEQCLFMGNMDLLCDWGHAKDYVRMQWMMQQQDVPNDFVIATGVQVTLREFISRAALELGVTLRFEGAGVNEIGVVEAISGSKASALKVGDVMVKADPR